MDLKELIESQIAGCRVLEVRELSSDVARANSRTLKTIGYGKPCLVRIEEAGGARRSLVFHTARADQFGHDRRADRAAEMLLAFDTFSRIPRHTQALDVGAVSSDGRHLISLRDSGEFYLLTSYVEGHLYADELREIARRGLVPSDVERVDTLVLYLVELHATKLKDPYAYRRSVRDMIGSGEGIFGIIDGYPETIPIELRSRLLAIESACVGFRSRLSAKPQRLCRTHGDFHPFNIVFSTGSDPILLDASRGSLGDPADDVACLAINYIFFALDRDGAWKRAFSSLWDRFWAAYLRESRDRDVLDVIAPYLAWRGLVLASPAWYGNLSNTARGTLLSLIERALDAPSFDPDLAHELFDE
jgi:aminoglycoside phosphotransferase (APT) family kinase protein